MIITRKAIPRRTVLRGLGAAVVVVDVGRGVGLDAQVPAAGPQRGVDGGEDRVGPGLVVDGVEAGDDVERLRNADAETWPRRPLRRLSPNLRRPCRP